MSNTGKNWKFTMFSCCNNACMSAFACLVPCSCAFIQCIDSKLAFPESSEYCGAYFCAFLCCVGMAYNRSQLRKKLSIEGNFFLDCICHSFCSCCAVVQEWREVVAFKFNDDKLHIFNYSSRMIQAPTA